MTSARGGTHLGHARHAADEQHLADLVLADAGVAERLLARRHCALDQLLHQVLKLRSETAARRWCNTSRE